MNASTNLIKSGKQLLDSGNYNDALSFFDQALSDDPTNADLWNYKGIALRSLGRYDEALECYNKSLEIEPRDKNHRNIVFQITLMIIFESKIQNCRC